ncbi:hypothetical protein C8R44DRAFT_894962 [Mycena epipterygia]|nr:hypothetical protein C8R44DRAFT_894962 [Mycena epipterygia]
MDTRQKEIPAGSKEEVTGSLRPTTSYYTGRYDNSKLVEPFSVEISPGLFTTSQDPEPEYLPPLWSAHVHPEGQLYFCRTHYGQEHSRLSRDQSILFDPEQKHPGISILMGYLTFKTSDIYLTRLDDVFVDHIVYVDQWSQFMSDCLQDWRRSLFGALSGLLLHLPFLILNFPSPALLTASVAVFGSGLTSSILLGHKYEPMQGLSATDAMTYLDTVHSPIFKFQAVAFIFSLPKALCMTYLDTIHSPVFKFQAVAFIFSLPKVLHLWGCVLFLANCLLVVAEYLGFAMAMGFTALSVSLILAHCYTTSEAFHGLLEKFTGMFSSKFEDAAVQIV